MLGILKNKLFTGKPKPYDAVHYLCTVKFLDNSDAVSVTYQKNTKGSFLIDHICSSINLIEKDYFGLKYTDADKVERWLDPIKTIYSQIKGLSNPLLYFQVKYYPSHLGAVKEEITRYQLFLQVRKDFNEKRLICSLDDALVLSAYIAQVEFGDYDKLVDEDDYVKQLKLPASLIGYEVEVKKTHGELKGLNQGSAEYKFLRKASSLTSYGIDPYIVSDVNGDVMYLALAPQGITIFQDNIITRVYNWRDIRKLSFDSKMFYIRLLDKQKGNEKQALINKSQQVASAGYKCLSHASCKQLWKNAVSHKYFYTLQTSNDAPKTVSSGGLLRRGSKFRYSGSCLAEVCRSSATINREEPKVTRRLSATQLDRDESRSSLILPLKQKKPKAFLDGINKDRTKLSPFGGKHDGGEARQDVRRTSSDSALEMTPGISEPKTPSLLDSGAGGKADKHNPLEEAKAVGLEVSSGSGDDDVNNVAGLFSGCGASLLPYTDVTWSVEPHSTSSFLNGSDGMVRNGGQSSRDFGDFVGSILSTASAINKSIIASPDSSTGPDLAVSRNIVGRYDSGTLDSGVVCGSNRSSEPFSGYESIRRCGVGRMETKGEKLECCDGGYMSGGSEKLNRSYDSDGSIIRANGISEEMEFAASDEGLNRSNAQIITGQTEAVNDSGPSDQLCGHHRLPSNLAREELLSLLSYGSKDLTPHENSEDKGPENEAGRPEGDLDRTATPPPSPLVVCNPEVTVGWVWGLNATNNARDDGSLSPRSTLIQPPPTPVEYVFSGSMQSAPATGILSSDNFKRIKEIEQMIEENRNKIRIMKETISTEMKKSRRRGNVAGDAELLDSRLLRGSTGHLTCPKQPKHVSFLSQDTDLCDTSGVFPGDLRSWEGSSSINRTYDDFDQNVDMTEGTDGCLGPDGTDWMLSAGPQEVEQSSMVEMVTMTPDGVFMSEAEICRCSDDGGNVDDEEAIHSDAFPLEGRDAPPSYRIDGANDVETEMASNMSATESDVEHTFTETVIEETFLTRISPEEFVQHFPSTSLEPPTSFLPSTFFLSKNNCHCYISSTNMSTELDEASSLNNGDKDSIEGKSPADVMEGEHSACAGSLGEDARPKSSGHAVKAFCKGVGMTLMSVVVCFVLFFAFLVVAFELDQDVPYLSNQQVIVELRRSVYGPAKDFFAKFFKK